MGEQVAAKIEWGCSSVGRAPALQAGGHEFESHHLHVGRKKRELWMDIDDRAHLCERDRI